jgi:hypothetical protein
MAEYTVRRLEDIDEISDGRCPFRPVRFELGITSFGVNAFTAGNAGDRIINEHDEEGEHEELYVVMTGRARFEIGGQPEDAPAGTLVFVQPGVTRTAFAEEPGTTLLAVGGQPGKAYEPEGYELWAPLAPLYESGQYAELADRAGSVLDEHPEYPGLAYNVACAESLAGRPEAAIEHLRRAIEGDEKYREYAAEDSDFDPVREEPGFSRLMG